MRLLTLVLFALVAFIQYPLWLGKGGWLSVHELERQLENQNTVNAQLKARNDSLSAEVKDLKEGKGAVEELARYELGMVKEGEVFVQVVEGAKGAAPAAASMALSSR